MVDTAGPFPFRDSRFVLATPMRRSAEASIRQPTDFSGNRNWSTELHFFSVDRKIVTAKIYADDRIVLSNHGGYDVHQYLGPPLKLLQADMFNIGDRPQPLQQVAGGGIERLRRH